MSAGATRSRASDAARGGDRELTLKAAADLTGVSGKLLRRYIRDGRLRPASMDGNRLTVTLSALRDAGLVPALPLQDSRASMDADATSASASDAARAMSDDEDAEDDDGGASAAASQAEAAASALRERAEREAREKAAREKAAAEKAAAEKAAAEKAAAEKAAAEKAAAEKAAAEKAAAEKAAAEKAAAEKAAAEKAAAEKAAAEKAAAEKAAAEKAAAEKAAAEKAAAEKAAREKAAAEKAAADKAAADKAAAERAARDKAAADKAAADKAAREKAERQRHDKTSARDREKAERARVERERAEAAAREKAAREKAEREKAEREKAEREAEAAKVVPMSRGRGAQLEDLDDLDETPESDELDERDLEEIEDELDDLPSGDVEDAETVRLQPESARGAEARVVTEVRGEPRPAERGLVVAGSGPFVTSNQLADLMRLLAAEREARAQEWMDRTEGLYREMLDAQRARSAALEEETKTLQAKLEDALRLVPKGENFQALEQMIRDLRIELDRKEAARADMEHERDRLRDLTDRLRNDLSRAEKRNLEMAEQLRRFRAQGIFDRILSREPDDR